MTDRQEGRSRQTVRAVVFPVSLSLTSGHVVSSEHLYWCLCVYADVRSHIRLCFPRGVSHDDTFSLGGASDAPFYPPPVFMEINEFKCFFCHFYTVRERFERHFEDRRTPPDHCESCESECVSHRQ